MSKVTWSIIGCSSKWRTLLTILMSFRILKVDISCITSGLRPRLVWLCPVNDLRWMPHYSCDLSSTLFSSIMSSQLIDRLSTWIFCIFILLVWFYPFATNWLGLKSWSSIFSQLYCPWVIDHLDNNCDHARDLMLSPITMGDTYFKP